MKKILSAFLALAMMSSFALANPYGVGARFAAMGGAGSALVDDTYSTYYNPAGMANSQAMSLKIGAGAAAEGMDKLIATLSSAGDPSKFILDNYANAIDIDGNLNAFIGINAGKIGLGIMPATSLSMNKAASTANGDAIASMLGQGVVSYGQGISAPFLGSLNAGGSFKYIVNAGGTAAVGGTTSVTDGYTYSGIGFDLGIQSKVDIPTAPVSVGVVMKNIGATLRGTTTRITKTINPATGSVESESETSGTGPDYTMPTTFVIGAAAKIPVVGLTVAIDIDSIGADNLSSIPAYSLTHIGLEYPVAMGLVNLRLGKVSGGPGGSVDMTTYGAGVLGNMINIAMVTDNVTPKNNQMMFDIGFGF